MDRRRSLAAMIGRHFAPWRKSRRTTLTALVFGLLMGRRLGLAAIARRMAGPVSVRHKIKRIGRFAGNGGVRSEEIEFAGARGEDAQSLLRPIELQLRKRDPVLADRQFLPGGNRAGLDQAPLPCEPLPRRIELDAGRLHRQLGQRDVGRIGALRKRLQTVLGLIQAPLRTQRLPATVGRLKVGLGTQRGLVRTVAGYAPDFVLRPQAEAVVVDGRDEISLVNECPLGSEPAYAGVLSVAADDVP